MSSLLPVDRFRGASNQPVVKAGAESYPLQSPEMVHTPRAFRRLGRIAVVMLFLVPVACVFLPWTQNIRGQGFVSAVNPQERPQILEAPIDGRIEEFHHWENVPVKKGELLVTLGGIDPELESRLKMMVAQAGIEVEAAKKQVKAEEDAREDLEEEQRRGLAAIDQKAKAQDQKIKGARRIAANAKVILEQFEKQVEASRPLVGDLISRIDFINLTTKRDEAKGKLGKAEADVLAEERVRDQIAEERASKNAGYNAKIQGQNAKIEKAKSELAKKEFSKLKAESDQAAQGTQYVTAPRDGQIFRVEGNAQGTVVKKGQPLLRFVPDTEHHAVEVWVDGNDAPLVSAGRPVRLQFEGWPAIQFSGWPSAAIGTFGGHVAQVDSQADPVTGMFRVLVVPDLDDESDWPNERYLRQGVQANAWILLEDVSVGFEIWRQLNGFPPRITQDVPAGGQKDKGK